MSGPKVVRIITREEMELIKASHISRLELIVNEIKAYTDKYKIFSDDQIREIENRLEKYKKLDASEYRKIRAEIPSHVEFIEKEKKRMESAAKKKVLSRRDKSRHLIASIKSLKAMYDKRSINLPENIIKIERNGQLFWLSSAEVESIERSVSEAFSTLNREGGIDKNLAKRLNQDQKPVLFSDWLMKTELVKPTASQKRLESIIAELEVQDIAIDMKEQLIDRSNRLFIQDSSQQLDMKIDTLSIEISTFIKESREKSHKLREYNNILNDLRRAEINGEKYNKIELKNSDTNNAMKIDEAVFKLTNILENEVKKKTSGDKREALLSAFESLGYDINDEMETVFVKNGRLIVNKNTSSTYGVELGSPSNLQRIQLRVVSNSENSSENTSKDDIAAEESWCEDFKKIKADFSSKGMLVEIDRHLNPGEVRMKTVDFESDRWKSTASKATNNRQDKIDK